MTDHTMASIESALHALAERFGLRVVRRQQQRGYTEITYANASTGLIVAVDWSEFRPFFWIFELENGKLPAESPLQTDPAQPSMFDVDDLLLLRAGRESPVGKMFPERSDVAVRNLLSEYALALERDASDVLCGDFSVFRQLSAIVNARAREMKARHT